MLVKSFSKIMRRLDKRFRNHVFTNVKYNQQQNSKGGNIQNQGKYRAKENKAKGTQCHEYEVFCHILTQVQIFLGNREKASIPFSLMMS